VDLGWHDCISKKYIKGNLTIYGMGSVTAAIQTSAWNWSFPTQASQLAWQVCSIGSFVGVLILVLSMVVLGSLSMVQKNEDFVSRVFLSFGRKLSYVLNFVFGVITGVYLMSRVGSLALALYCLEDLPGSAFKEIQWTGYLPNIS
jgi:hypothetical protein